MRVKATIAVRVATRRYPAGTDEGTVTVGASVERRPHRDGEHRIAGREVVEGWEEGGIEEWSDLTARQQGGAAEALIEAFEAEEERLRQVRRTPEERARWARLEEAADVLF